MLWRRQEARMIAKIMIRFSIIEIKQTLVILVKLPFLRLLDLNF
jgi:hypothetical protein